MSNVVAGIVQRKRVGSPTRKAVLMYMAGCASDDGSGVWASKANMARDLEMGRRTIQDAVDHLIKAGLIREVGQRECKNGYTVEYAVDLHAVQALEGTRAGAAPVREPHTCDDRTSTRAGAAHEPVREPRINHPRNHKKNRQDQTDDFDAFWEECPRKVGKGAARKAYAKAVKQADPEAIQAGMIRHAREVAGKDPQYIPHPATWLNGERWDDQPAKPSQPGQVTRLTDWDAMERRAEFMRRQEEFKQQMRSA